ncbi:MAG: hypothetical protein J5812_00680 [Candidatus Methanomethylophilaceae archaeon]|nr:hypothetical protein [Candidatus Methanomethylophilaceae archaeon]
MYARISTDGVLYFRKLVGGSSPTPPEALREEHERCPLAEFFGHHDLKQMVSEGYVSEPLDEGPAWIALGINGKEVSKIVLKKHSECDILSKKIHALGFYYHVVDYIPYRGMSICGTYSR